MAFRNPIDTMTGMGQRFGADQLSWTTQYGLNRKTPADLSPGARKNVGMIALPPQKPRKTGFFVEEDDSETSMYFGQSTMFRPDKEMLTSQSPSQLSAFGSNIYNQNISSLPIQQRGITGARFPPQSAPGHITPTSMNPNFPIGMQQQVSPNRNLISAIGQRGGLNPTQASQPVTNIQKRAPLVSGLGGSASQITGMPHPFGFTPGRGVDGSQTGLDLSEFPTLGNRTVSSNPMSAARNYGMISKPVQDQAPEFQIQQEDFPALPGAQNPPSSTANDSSRKTPTSGTSTTYEQALSKDGAKFPGDKSTNQRKGIQTHPDGTVSNIPNGMVTDQFGIVGLLTFMRAIDEDPNLVSVSPGIDLTTIGLNPRSTENLYSTFQSPWADSPCRPQDIDFHVPSEYLTNIFIRDKLAPIKLNRYGEDLLFFLFYMHGGDVLQLASAAELYTRDWRYHKEERVWITRAPGVEPMMKTNSYERGTYYFFDADSGRKVAKEFLLEYDKLEDRPHLPPTLHHNPNQPIVAH